MRNKSIVALALAAIMGSTPLPASHRFYNEPTRLKKRSESDLEALRKAEEKRARKAAKRIAKMKGGTL